MKIAEATMQWAEEEISLPALHHSLRQGAVVLTATRRLSRNILASHAEYRRARGEQCWRTPQVLPWSAWLSHLWDERAENPDRGRTQPQLLSASQNRLLWDRVIRRSRLSAGILNISRTATGVARAWALQQAWSLPMPQSGDHLGEDADAYRQWAQEFEHECRREGFVDMPRLAPWLAGISGTQLRLPARLLLMGFDELTAQQQKLLAHFKTQGIEISRVNLPVATTQSGRTVSQVRCDDDEDELARAAGWARRRLQGDAQANIAIVVPDLQTRRRQIERIFDDVMHPAGLLPANRSGQRCFNLAAGTPLSAAPLIRIALQILELARGKSDIQVLGCLLRSPYLGDGLAEASGRARLDLRLRERGDQQVWLADMLGMARRAPAGENTDRVLAPRFLAQLERLFVHHRNASGRRRHGEWAAIFTGCLQAMQWPGERALDSEEFQQHQAWQNLLDTFAALEVVSQPIDFSRALSQVNELASEQLFQPQSPPQPVQVMGLLEAGGQRFDALWVCGMDDENWPPPARPDPWLPIDLQKQYALPGVNADREFEVAQRRTQALQSSAPEVIFSFAARVGDRERRASPLTADLPRVDDPHLAPADIHLFRDLIAASQRLENVVDDRGLPIAAPPVRGGSGVLAAQAACPFQAFARYRLNARALEEPVLGSDAAERGSLLHDGLQRVWSKIAGSRQLQGMRESELLERVEDAVAQTLEQARQRRPRTYTPKYLAIDQQLLVTAIMRWLEIEQQQTFFTVAAVEHKAEVELAGLRLQLKLDRVDRDAQGAQIVLDYKTGRVSTGGWDDERPDAPQLPLYALALETPPAAVAFAQIRPGAYRFSGCGRGDTPLPGVRGDEDTAWQARLALWRENLGALAQEFAGGAAGVAPKNYPQTCRYCDLAALCRIQESAMPTSDEQDDKA